MKRGASKTPKKAKPKTKLQAPARQAAPLVSPSSAENDGLIVGDLAPWFHGRALNGNPRYAFDTVGGRYILMLFFGSAAQPDAAEALQKVAATGSLFDDQHACFFGISHDPEDESTGRLTPRLPGWRFFLDYDRTIERRYAFAAMDALPDKRCWVLIDPMMRVIGRFALDKADLALNAVAALSRQSLEDQSAPVLVIPHVLEPNICKALIDSYESGTPEISGFMREVDGKTTLLHDAGHKVRSDYLLEDPRMMRLLSIAVRRRLVPMIRRVFQFDTTRMERYIVSCYDAESGGHFAAHRDNTTSGTAHRRFAVTINLNAEDYDGGNLSFPEFGPREYRAPTGGAVVFSCSLLHRATPVTRGRRYAFLPFLYDESAAELRAANNAFLGDGTTPYDINSDRIV
jgi:hypothetical protein